MTMQTPETLHYNGQKLPMDTEPLGSYFSNAGEKPEFASNDTGLWRGYVGTWEIRDQRLYLIDLSGWLSGGLLTRGDSVTLKTFFPESPDRVFAKWYSGTLRAFEGDVLGYTSGGYWAVYEREVYIEIVDGVVRNTRVQQNSAPKASDVELNFDIDFLSSNRKKALR